MNRDDNLNQEFYFNMDNNDNNDYRDLHDLIIARRTSFRNEHDIQNLNYTNSPLLNLPTEVLLQIFHHLERKDLYSLLTVCREFADLIIEILWFRPNMQNDGSFKKIKAIMELNRNATHWDYRTFIKRLNLSFMTKLVDDNLLSLFIGCPKLERLTLVNCTKLTHKPITDVLQNCGKLQSIDLTGVNDIHDDIIYALAKNCTRLQGLYAPGCGSVSESAILKLLGSCPMLKRVKFNNSENITDESIKAMHKNCKSLVEVDLHNCSNVSDKYLKHIFLDLTQLREFRISKAVGITDKLFELIPDDHYLEKLRIIDITDCNAISDKLVEKLVKCAPRLRNVVLSKCMRITDASLRALALLGRSLHYIHLGHCVLITDFGVQSLVRSCHRIQYIDLACCSQLTDWTLVELATLPKLRRIGLVKCNLISDGGIMELVRRRGEQDCLERVHLSYCTNLSITPIYMLLKNCPRLTHLSLTGITAFLRREITQYCRDPPPDFNEVQRSSFCVFSGQGVNQLRNHLNQVMEERTYLVEHGDFNNPIDLRRAQMERLPHPVIRGPNDLTHEERIDAALGRRRTANDMNAWATQRGLGVLQNTVPEMANDPGMQDFNREIFRELAEGTMTPEQMREHFHNLLINYYEQRDMANNNPNAGDRITLNGNVTNGNNNIVNNNNHNIINNNNSNNNNNNNINNNFNNNINNNNNNNNITTYVPYNEPTTNAPQIVQPAVFPNGEVNNNNNNNNEEDVEMEPVDLFPRNHNDT